MLGGAPAGVGLGDGVSGDAGEAIEEDALLGLDRSWRGVSDCAWTRASSGASCLRTATVAGWLLTKTRPLPVERISRRRMISVPSASMPFCFEDGFGAGSGLEDAGDDGFVGAVADDVGRGFAAHEEGERVDEDGFACAGFAGEEVEAGTERGDGVIDDGVVFSAQFDEHG